MELQEIFDRHKKFCSTVLSLGAAQVLPLGYVKLMDALDAFLKNDLETAKKDILRAEIGMIKCLYHAMAENYKVTPITVSESEDLVAVFNSYYEALCDLTKGSKPHLLIKGLKK